MIKPYQGHRSWNAWNVSLWLNNTESLYKLAMYYLTKYKAIGDTKGYTKRRVCNIVARILRKELDNKTPDGAVYTQLSVMLAIMGMLE